MRRRSVLAITFAGIAGAAVVACLNPQPLPPSDSSPQGADSDASAEDDSGGFGLPSPPTDEPGGNQDAGATDAGLDGSSDASDAGDAAADADGG
jgi:hypothetical protein